MSSIIYDLAVVEDWGAYWRVTNVMQNTLDNQANRNEKLLKLSYMSHQMIKNALLENKIVNIPKTLRTTEVLPGEFNIIDLKELDEIQEERNAAIIKIRMLVTPELSKISGFTMYGFIILNNDLASAGYFITNDNREEKYLEILETENEKLISKLEDYLNYKDEIERLSQLERNFSQFRQAVQSANTAEEIKKLEEKFLTIFYKHY